jgi:uroporphyrinogen-III synthase
MRIAITRIGGKEARDPATCARYGHECYSVSPLQAAIDNENVQLFAMRANEGCYDCIFFTSALTARLVAPLIRNAPRIIAIGPQTKGALEEAGIAVPVEVLQSFYSSDFVPYLGTWIRGRRIGIPRADVPNPALIQAICAAGGIPEEVACYALKPTGNRLDLEHAEAVLFTSVLSFRSALWLRHPSLVLVAIGKRTAEAMIQDGCVPAVVGNGSISGTLEALNRYLEGWDR